MFLEISQNSQQNTSARVCFLNKVVDLRPATLLKKRLWHRCFSVDFAKFLRTHFSRNTSARLLRSILRLLDCNHLISYCTHFMFHATDLFWYTPENVRKPLVFWCFQRVSKEIRWSITIKSNNAVSKRLISTHPVKLCWIFMGRLLRYFKKREANSVHGLRI